MARTNTLAFGLLMIMLVVSVLISPLPQRSLAAAVPLAVGLGVYALLDRVTLKESWLHWVGRGLVLICAGLCLLALPVVSSPGHLLAKWLPAVTPLGRLYGKLANENVVAGALLVCMPFTIATGLMVAPSPRRIVSESILAWLVAGAALVAIGFTGSRGAYLGVIVSLMVLFVLVGPRPVVRLVLLVVLILTIVGVAIYGWQVVADALLTSSSTRGLAQREEIWSRALYLIEDMPFTGIGLNCFEPVVAAVYPLFLIPAGTVTHAHNLFLQVAVDLGIPGLLAYLVVLGSAFCGALIARGTFRLVQARNLQILAAACLASLSGMCVHGLIDAAVWNNKGAFLPWVVLGLSMALYRKSCQKARIAQDRP
jgi:putative inorganic carbon (hco3(-)) transporter